MEAGQEAPFATLLRRYRRAAGLTQEDLAARAGLGERTVGDLERGAARAPRRDTVDLLATALALAPDERAALEAARAPRNAPARAPAGGAADLPLVGRERELALIEQHLAGEGPPALLLAGEPGIGKSRLLAETIRRAGGCGWQVLSGGCTRRGGQERYAPLVEALERHIQGQAPAQVRGDLRGCTGLVRLLPELAAQHLLPEAPPADLMDPGRERRLMFAAASRFLANTAGPAGTLLVLDDLQWAGADAFDLLAALVRAQAAAPLRVVGAYRDTEVQVADALCTFLADLAQGHLIANHPLEPLAPRDARRLLAGLLADGAEAPAALIEQVVERTGGLPFFLVSYARGLLAGTPEDAALAGVPWTAAQSVRQRLAALPGEAQDLLGMAAVAGREVPRSLLVGATGQGERAVVAALAAACRARLIEEAGAHAYRFCHDVIREVVESELGAGRRALLHREIAQALEALPGPPAVEALAHHYGGAEEHDRAGYWRERAGDRAAAGFAPAAALAHYQAARGHLQADGAEDGVLSRLDEKIGDAHASLGEPRSAQVAFARARSTERDPVRRAALWCKEGRTWQSRGNFGPALDALDLDRALAAFAAAEAQGETAASLPAPLRAAIAVGRGYVHWQRGEYAPARTRAEEVLAILDGENVGATQRARIEANALLGEIARDHGDLERADDLFRRNLAAYEQRGDLPGLADTAFALGFVWYHQPDRAESWFRQALALYERLGDTAGSEGCWDMLGDMALQRSEFARAAECYARCGDRSTRGQLALERGDLAMAGDCFRLALDRAERLGNSGGGGGVAAAWNCLGSVAFLRGDLDAGEECFRRSRAIMEAMGPVRHPGIVVRASCRLGSIACERGDLEEALRLCRGARREAGRIGAAADEALAAIWLVRARVRRLPAGASSRWAMRLLELGCAVATRRGLGLPTMHAALLAAEVPLHLGLHGLAHAAAERALERASGQQRRLEEGVARRLLGQCALAQGAVADAVIHLRAALAGLDAIGAALEAARTRVVLAQALAAQVGEGPAPDEAHILLAAASAQVAASGAALDRAQLEHADLPRRRTRRGGRTSPWGAAGGSHHGI